MARINLRLSEQLKARIEEAAASEKISANAWLARAAAAALDNASAYPLRPTGPGPAAKRLAIHRLGPADPACPFHAFNKTSL